ncbi:hypothetical protein ACXYMU_17315 [Pontibacter sp. CAU 1760]
MAKVIIKYLLTLCILLLGVSSHLYAQACQDFTGAAFVKSVAAAELISHVAPSKAQNPVIQSTSAEESFNTDALEVEEDKEYFSLFKKLSESSQFLAALVHAFTFGYLFRFLTKYVGYSRQHIPFLSSYRSHIILRVFQV